VTTTEALVWGPEGPPPAAERIKIGRVEAELDGADLRWVTVDGIEIVRRLYVAVRDHNWDTIPPSVLERKVVMSNDHVDIRLRVGHVGTVHFEWHGEISVAESGEITFEIRGSHLKQQRYNRVGIVVHHPPERMSGCSYSLSGPAGPAEGVLPHMIGPQAIVNGRPAPLIPTFERLELHDREVACQFEFEGDLFEIEDQRNWTDGSFKTYSTPLSSDWPFTAEPDEHVRQSLRLEVRYRTAVSHRPPAVGVTARIGARSGQRVPAFGFDHPPDAARPGPDQIDLLRTIASAYLRIEFGPDTTAAYLAEASALARDLDWPVELSINGDSDDLPDVDLRGLEDLVVRIVVTRRAGGTADAEHAQRVRDRIGFAGRIPLVAGTNAYFVDLNRDRPDMDGCDGVAYPICPQVHASDIRSMVEGVITQSDTVETARMLFGLPVHVGPVALAPRFNPNATDVSTPVEWPPPSVDLRQPTLFTASWTVASVAALTAAGANSVTYYQLMGWRGILGDRFGPRPEHPPGPDMVFPAFHVLADVASMSGYASAQVSVSDPMRVAAVAAVDDSGEVTVLVSNLSGQPTRLMLDGVGTAWRVRRLCADSESEAFDCRGAVSWRSMTEAITGPSLTLAPFETDLIRERQR